jgi:hypothetical protein
MSGFITKAECVENRQFIVDTWGLPFYNACLEAEGQTFLGLLIEKGLI